MKKQIIVIGLGQFGMGLIKTIATKKHAEVIAIDRDEKKTQEASAFVSQSYCFDATDEESLLQLSPAQRDVCICATGDQSKEAAIICTALLKQMGAPRVIARANDELHSRILKLVGADEVINPEWEFGQRFANRIFSQHLLEEMSLGEDLVVSEFKAPPDFVNKSILTLHLRREFGITVIAIKSAKSRRVKMAQPDDILQPGDILIVVSNRQDLEKLAAR